METNDEIIERQYDKDVEDSVYADSFEKTKESIHYSIHGAKDLMDKAREDTATQIISEIEKEDTGYGDVVISKEKLQELKLAFLPRLKSGVSSEVS